MPKARTFTYLGNQQADFIDEWKGAFNNEAFLDDQFIIQSKSIIYLFDGAQWYRGLASPFYLDDAVHFGRIGQKKTHQKHQRINIFTYTRDMIYQDEWALDYVQKKRIKDFNHDLQGKYQFSIQRGDVLLTQLESLGLHPGTIPFLDFSKKMNSFIQHDIIQLLANLRPPFINSQIEELKKQIQTNISQRFLTLGLELVQFEVEFIPSKR
jgi:hypothetical protein